MLHCQEVMAQTSLASIQKVLIDEDKGIQNIDRSACAFYEALAQMQ